MNKKKIFIYNNHTLYNIFYELEEFINFKVYKIDEKNLKSNFQDINNNLLISNTIIRDIINQYHIDILPINFFKLLENINITFLKKNFKDQAKIKIGRFFIDINSRKLIYDNNFINLTEKEVNLILYLFNCKESCSIENLQKNVWSFKNELETHTVETHIYRLRKKISSKFSLDNFIIFKDDGYYINI